MSNRMEMENKQLRLQLANALDQAQKYKELNKVGSDAYNDLAKKVKNFCEKITSIEYARRQITQNNKRMGIDELLEFAIQEYDKQKKEFQEFAAKLSDQIDQRDEIIEDLQKQISIYEIQLAQPSYISDEPNFPQEQNTNEPMALNIQNNSQNTNQNNFEDEFAPIGVPTPNNIGMPNIDDEFASIPSGMPPLNGMPTNNNPVENTIVANGTKKVIVESLDEEDFMPVSPRHKAEVLTPTKHNYTKKSNENPDGGEYVEPTVNSVEINNQNQGVKETQKNAIKMKLANEKKKKDQMLMISDIGPLINEVKENKIWYNIMSLIGIDGLSQRPKIEEKLAGRETGSGKTSLSTQITSMQKAGLITRENINTGYRHFIILEIAAPIGVRVFEEIFGKSPVETEARRLTRENASKEHGYLIEDARAILTKEFGYKHVSIDRARNTIDLKNGKKYIPDIVATIDGKVWDYIEVERGTHTREDFNEKLEKMYMTTRTFHFIAQNKETLDVIINKTTTWLDSKTPEQKKGLTIKYSTLSHLAKRNWLEIKKY